MIVMSLMVPLLTSCNDFFGNADEIPPVIEVTGLKITGAGLVNGEATMQVGETLLLQSNIYPQNANFVKIGWKSSNTGVVTVSESGIVTAVGGGDATVTLWSRLNPNVQDYVVIHVANNTPSVGVNNDPVDQSQAEARKM